MLHRSTQTNFNTSGDGHTLEGVALHWETVNNVTDDGMTFYDEMFARASADKTLRERAAVPLPLGYMHPWQPATTSEFPDEQIGSVKFRAAEEGLIFQARMFRSESAEQVLAEVNSGRVTDVSVGFNPYKHDEMNGVVVHKEIGLLELSLAQTGLGQHAGAQVLAVRSNLILPQTTSLAEVRRQLDFLNL